MDVQFADLVTVALLVVIEGLLSADNALVMAIMILGLPRPDQHKALRYGLIGAFAFRIVATALEFWQGQPNRLHDRVRYALGDGDWFRERLGP